MRSPVTLKLAGMSVHLVGNKKPGTLAGQYREKLSATHRNRRDCHRAVTHLRNAGREQSRNAQPHRRKPHAQ